MAGDKTPSRVTQRRPSKQTGMLALVEQIVAKREYFGQIVKRIEAEVTDDETLNRFTKNEAGERIITLESVNTSLEANHFELVCDTDEATSEDTMRMDRFNVLISSLKVKLKDRIDALNKSEPQQAIQNVAKDFRIEVQQLDAAGNVPNIWGKFNGDYSKWKSFRDRWLASMHNNAKVQTIVKFQNLKAACVGSAEGALGEWDLTEENYLKAWNRLCSIYENDYMQVQSFMKMLDDLPMMRGSSSKAIRETIDLVQKHINGLDSYIDLNKKHPYVVFKVISKMDSDTYRAWEKYRPTLAKNRVHDAEQNGTDESEFKPGKYIPVWSELEQFLENEVTIRVHAENHSPKNEYRPKLESNKQSKHFNKHSNQNKEIVPDFLQCVLCDDVHTIFNCDIFREMNLAGRLNHVAEHNLCVKCLRKSHTGRCKNKRCNEECPKCKPEKKFHNSWLCPNAAVDIKTVLKVNNDSKKRKYTNSSVDRQNKKFKRYNTNDDKRTNRQGPPSSVLKVGSWSLQSKSNAVKQIQEPKESKFGYTVLLATVNMRIQTNARNIVDCRAIADTGATLNCISEQFVEQNELKTIKCQKRVLGIGGPETIKRKVIAFIQPWFESDTKIKTEFFILKQLDGRYPGEKIDASKDQIMHFQLADPKFDEPAPIDALIGADIYANIVGPELYKHTNGAMMQLTSFGYIILGKFLVKAKNIHDIPILNIMHNYEDENESIVKALNRFWEIEEINKHESITLSKEQQMVEDNFMNTYYRDANGRFTVTIPVKPNHPKLGESKHIALKQFYQLERKLSKNEKLKSEYTDYMREYIKLGYMKPASNPSPHDLTYYLPHHAVLSKFRIVLDASRKTTTGESLNSIQMVGGKLQYDSQLQTMRFRRHRYAAATDITKMFNKVGLNPTQWNLHRLFWRESPNDPLKEYVMTVVIFGEASSAFNAVRSMIECARQSKKNYPQAAEVIEKSFYIDDGLFGCDNVPELKILCREVEFVLGSGGFTLKGWTSNSKEVEAYMSTNVKGIIVIGKDDETKVLGLRWNKSTDNLTIAVKQLSRQKSVTKRSILKEIATLYDPNGFIAPIIIKAKMIMQDIWRLKQLDWDDVVPQEIEKEWLCIYENLPMLNEFKMKRWLNMDKRCEVQIHAFCDASEKAYGTAIYVRVVNNNREIFCTLLSAKSRVAPLKEVTIPRLELLAAVMLSEQTSAIIKACEFQKCKTTFWSDSTIVLSWIKKQTHELKAFVGNRVEIIQEKTKGCKWKHVCSGDNPADLVSRGMQMRDFLDSKLWLEGPEWLKMHESRWPVPKLIVSPEANKEIEKECKVESVSYAFNIFSGVDNTLLYNKFNEWNKVINITAYVLRVFCKPKIAHRRFLTVKERTNAMEFWIKIEQGNAFRKEIQCIKAGESLPAKSSIASLRPILDKNGILRVGGRIDKANISYERKHQYIIPHKSRLSYLLLNHAHKETMHGGAQIMMQFLRTKFWIPKLRFEARIYANACVECVRQAKTTVEQIMGELPEVRVKPAPPFQHVGIDMAGPYNMRLSSKINMNTRMRNMPEMKGWIAVFVCLITRAVHLEVVEGMSSDDFLVAYLKFTGRRGDPERIYTDNGTNFVGADTELKNAAEVWKSDMVQHHVSIRGTEWNFITPSAPHEGGIWEAAVKSMKHHLKRVMGTQKYSFQCVSALLVSVEACLNSRPLCTLSDDVNDNEALTPAHFLIGRSLKLPIHEKMDMPPHNIKRLYLQLQSQLQAFWKQWSNDYLQFLMQLPKWREQQENLKVGQLVIIKAENIPPTYWAMGRITRTHEGEDGKVRSVTLKTQTGELVRSVRKICVLPTDIEISYWK